MSSVPFSFSLRDGKPVGKRTKVKIAFWIVCAALGAVLVYVVFFEGQPTVQDRQRAASFARFSGLPADAELLKASGNLGDWNDTKYYYLFRVKPDAVRATEASVFLEAGGPASNWLTLDDPAKLRSSTKDAPRWWFPKSVSPDRIIHLAGSSAAERFYVFSYRDGLVYAGVWSRK